MEDCYQLQREPGPGCDGGEKPQQGIPKLSDLFLSFTARYVADLMAVYFFDKVTSDTKHHISALLGC